MWVCSGGPQNKTGKSKNSKFGGGGIVAEVRLRAAPKWGEKRIDMDIAIVAVYCMYAKRDYFKQDNKQGFL